jgi:hypothetical protein
MRRASSRNSRPAALSFTPRGSRSNSLNPNSASRSDRGTVGSGGDFTSEKFQGHGVD